MKVRPNGLLKEVPKETTIQRIAESLRELGAYGFGHGVEIWVEVHGRDTQEPPVMAAIMRATKHEAVGLCWNSNPTDLDGDGFDANFSLVENKMFTVHMRDLFLDDYPFRRLFARLKAINFTGFTFAEIPESTDPVRVMKYFRGLWLAYQDIL